MELMNSGAAGALDGGAGGTGAGDDLGAGGRGDQGGAGDDQGGAGGDGGGAQDPDWYAGLAEQPGDGETASNRDYARSKGFKDLDGVVKAYRGAEKALHDSGRIKVPGDGATDEERFAFHKAIGVPDDAKGYEVTLPENSGGLELDGDMIGSLAEIAHKQGVPKAGFEAITNAYVEHQVKAHLEMVQREDAGREAVFSEWGATRAQHVAECNAAMRALGLTQADVASLQVALATPEQAGSARVLKLLQKIGGGMAEDVLLTGGSGRFGVTPAEAQVRIDTIKKDPALAAKVRIRDSAEQLEWKRLNAIVGEARGAETQA